MADTKKRQQKNERTPNISVHYYTDPIYGSGSIYGFEEYAEDSNTDKCKQDKGDALDEPLESWGWVNNVD